MDVEFVYDERLKISLPRFHTAWDELEEIRQAQILRMWEEIRGNIPERIKELEELINEKNAALSEEMNFEHSCLLNTEIAELASIINDLWIWFRLNPSLSKG
ncbi:hypothetical protein BpOF4_03485 [Alkalihalophilus pseudofirmus OF4]|uniref:Uncharacterized protein n=1 Tax=Alkalihalophilus pseudofirmus (strain ATCC BAA-2126 / JCM 17055 / OF4) TaxID=398511 RepID=D3FX08_ALKPO|nr:MULTISPECIES: hypothetical protein [Alkalihalophilus]ADC48763.1 hypothetical protein BpOF4_03485 [Alkalihalophilus pseudofirmus OF4]MED1600270.1 hypothetical protein [Alkalihalophilus marmarensis]